MSTDRAGRIIAVRALALLSAASAGAHETVWARLLGCAVGNTSFGLGLALAAFMGGMGVGTLLAPRVPWLWQSPRRAYALAELTIAAGSLAVVGYCLRIAPLSARLGFRGPSALGFDLIAAALVTLPPAIAAGATYPLLVRATIRTPADVPDVSRLYRMGLLGALLGFLGTGIVGAPRLGLDVTAGLASVVNIAVAIGGVWLLPRPERFASPTSDVSRTAEDTDARWRFGVASAFGLSAQVVWNRCLVPYAGVSSFTFATIVATYVSAQAIGFSIVEGRPIATRERIADVALAGVAPLALLSFALVSPLGAQMPSRDHSPTAWTLAVLGIVALVVGPTSTLLGVSQAAALARVEQQPSGWDAGAARIVGTGTIASVVGALGATLVGVPVLGPRGTILAAGLAIAGVLLLRRRWRVAVACAGLTALAMVASPGPRWFLGPAYDGASVLFARHDVQDTVAVITLEQPVEIRVRRLVANGVSYSGDSIFAQRYMRLLAHLPALASHGERRALVICVGTGTTLDALRLYRYEKIDAVDISPSIRRTLAFFRRVNHDAQNDPRVSLVLDDGVRFLRATREAYDVVTLEPPPPRAPGGSALYTREFYEAVRARLSPGGALAQWLPLHDLSGVEAAAIVRTIEVVFPAVSLHLVERNEAILVARMEVGPLPVAAAERRTRAFVAADLADVGLNNRDPWTDTVVIDGDALVQAIGAGPVLRDAWPYPEYAPLAGANNGESPLAAFIERLRDHAATEPSSSAAHFLAMAPAFIRVTEGDAQPSDRPLIHQAMLEMLREDPSNSYMQHAFGYGALLEERLRGLAEEGLPATRRAELESQMIHRRAEAEMLLASPQSHGGR